MSYRKALHRLLTAKPAQGPLDRGLTIFWTSVHTAQKLSSLLFEDQAKFCGQKDLASLTSTLQPAEQPE